MSSELPPAGDHWRYDGEENPAAQRRSRSKHAVPIPDAWLRSASSVADLGMWMAIGEAWAQITLHFLPSRNPLVLDIGCGCGKMARFLMAHPRLRYVGLDVYEPAIAWSRAAFEPLYGDRARFLQLDAYSELYNPAGRMSAETLRLPLDDESVDFVICGSLFTHLLEPEMDHYLAEISRVVRPGGRMLASIHNEPASGQAFSGNVTRIDMTNERFLAGCSGAGLTESIYVGNLYGQHAFVLTRARKTG